MVRYINGKDKPTEINVITGTGNGSNTDFTVTQGSSVAKVLVTINGVAQAPTTDYTISGTTLSFVVAPANNDDIVIREYPV